MREVSVRRWRRYGRDRLYVTDAAGLALGWHDLATGETHVAVAEAATDVEAAIARWRATVGGEGRETVDPAEQRTDLMPPVPELNPPGRDLAANRPGELAREQAVTLRQAAPVRTFFERLVGARTEERAWRIGADGETRVAADLEMLHRRDPRWCAIHAVPVGDRGSDIDHVVIGPGGVFTLNAKNHPGASVWLGGDTLMVNGSRHPYVRNSRFEARRAARLLGAAVGCPVPVRGVIVLVGIRRLTVRETPDDVDVLAHQRLVRRLTGGPGVLGIAMVDQVYEAARRESTWRART